MKEKITLCGDNCIMCPRYNANTNEELKAVAELGTKLVGAILLFQTKK